MDTGLYGLDDESLFACTCSHTQYLCEGTSIHTRACARDLYDKVADAQRQRSAAAHIIADGDSVIALALCEQIPVDLREICGDD